MSVTLGPKLGLLINADIGDSYGDAFRVLLRFFDAMLMGGVISSSIVTPPTTPNNGDAYLLLGSPTGAWAGQANAIAVWSTEITIAGTDTKVPGWEFWTPNAGWVIWDNSVEGSWIFKQGAWATAGSGGGSGAGLITVASSPTTTFNFALSLKQKTVITANTTITFSGANAGDEVTVILTQAGGFTVTWAGNISGMDSSAGMGGSAVYMFIFDGTTYLLVNDPVVGQ